MYSRIPFQLQGERRESVHLAGVRSITGSSGTKRVVDTSRAFIVVAASTMTEVTANLTSSGSSVEV